MEANSLMLGDWYANTDGDKCRVIKHFGKEVWGEGDNVSDATDNPQPILLTPEILEKNGFIQDYSYDECVADNCFIEIKGWSYNADNILITWDGCTCQVVNDIGFPCEEITLHSGCRDGIYVHELQRALRMCGLWELANNFKVE